MSTLSLHRHSAPVKCSVLLAVASSLASCTAAIGDWATPQLREAIESTRDARRAAEDEAARRNLDAAREALETARRHVRQSVSKWEFHPAEQREALIALEAARSHLERALAGVSDRSLGDAQHALERVSLALEAPEIVVVSLPAEIAGLDPQRGIELRFASGGPVFTTPQAMTERQRDHVAHSLARLRARPFLVYTHAVAAKTYDVEIGVKLSSLTPRGLVLTDLRTGRTGLAGPAFFIPGEETYTYRVVLRRSGPPQSDSRQLHSLDDVVELVREFFNLNMPP